MYLCFLDCNGGFRRRSVRSECDKELSDSHPGPDLRLPNPDSQRARQIVDDYRSVIHANILYAYKSLVICCSFVLLNSLCWLVRRSWFDFFRITIINISYLCPLSFIKTWFVGLEVFKYLILLMCFVQERSELCVWWRLKEWSSLYLSLTCLPSLSSVLISLRQLRVAISLPLARYRLGLLDKKKKDQ